MLQPLSRFAFVDIQTTGGSAQAGRIIEIAIIRVSPEGVREWSSLVNPDRSISPAVQSLTGITKAMVAKAPIFEELAGQIADMLSGYMLVAHHARTAYGTLKRAYSRMNADFQTPVLCTAKLSQRLFPSEKQHSLDAIVSRYGLAFDRDAGARHRALGNARATLQFWEKLQRVCSAAELQKAMGKLAVSPGLAPATGDTMPRPEPELHETAQRPADPRPPAPRLSWQDASSELQALLSQNRQARQGTLFYSRPLHRTTSLYSWRLSRDLVSGKLELTVNDAGLGVDDQLYGLFKGRARARNWLLELVEEHGLCATHLGLEKQPAGHPCAARQARHCLGACVGQEPADVHFGRVMQALAPHRVQPWPYAGPVLVAQDHALHVLYRWSYIAVVQHAEYVDAVLAQHQPFEFSHDVYRTLRASLEATLADAAEPHRA